MEFETYYSRLILDMINNKNWECSITQKYHAEQSSVRWRISV